jgi:predicted TIM-barrel fold metal-dependent hydrolase
MKIYDCHTHWWPDASLTLAEQISKWEAAMDLHSISSAVVLPMRGLLNGAWVREDNDSLARAARLCPDRMLAFCTVNVWEDKDAIAELERCLALKIFRGIKFHPWLQACPPNGRVMDQICEIAAEAGLPILYHDGTPPLSLPSQIGLLAYRHPKTQIILGHCGMLEFWREAIVALNHCSNLWGCLCSPHLAAIKEIVKSAPRQRLLWGSDFGFGPYDLIRYRLPVLDFLPEANSMKEAFLSANPQALFATA